MNVTPIHDESALFIEELASDGSATGGSAATLVIADLHIGIEHQMFESGAKMPSRTDDMKHRLLKLLADTGAERLAIAGDVKHSVPLSSFQESREIPRFFDELLAVVDNIQIAPGNHDGHLSRFLPEGVVLHSSKGFVLGDAGIWHGHAWPSAEVMASETVIFAHLHPVALFVDNLGTKGTAKCWLRGKWSKKRCAEKYEKVGKEFILMPAFNDMCGGTYMNEKNARLFGVVARNKLANIQNAEMYLQDGTQLGKVRDNLAVIDRKWNAGYCKGQLSK